MDDSRFESIYGETYHQILGYALRRCDSPEDAADLVAETFAIAWRRRASIPKADEARLWLYGVARNVLANHRRDQARRPKPAKFELDLANLYASTERAPEDTVGLTTIATAFGALSPDDRELLALVAWEGLDHGEIAVVLDCSRNAVRVRLHRARKRFSRALAAVGIIVNRYVVESV